MMPYFLKAQESIFTKTSEPSIFELKPDQKAANEIYSSQSASLSPEFCSVRKSMLDAKIQEANLPKIFVNSLVQNNSKLILFGERHDVGLRQRQLQVEWMRTLKKKIPKINCLFLEFPNVSAIQDEIKFWRGELSSFQEEMLMSSVQNILRESHKLGIQVYPVDAAKKYSKDKRERLKLSEWALTPEGILERNQIMANQMESHFDMDINPRRGSENQTCEVAIGIFGKYHISSAINGVEKSLLQNFKTLKKENYVSVNWISAIEYDDGEWKLPSCHANPETPKKNILIKSSDLPDILSLDGLMGRMNSFDWTFVFH